MSKQSGADALLPLLALLADGNGQTGGANKQSEAVRPCRAARPVCGRERTDGRGRQTKRGGRPAAAARGAVRRRADRSSAARQGGGKRRTPARPPAAAGGRANKTERALPYGRPRTPPSTFPPRPTPWRPSRTSRTRRSCGGCWRIFPHSAAPLWPSARPPAPSSAPPRGQKPPLCPPGRPPRGGPRPKTCAPPPNVPRPPPAAVRGTKKDGLPPVRDPSLFSFVLRSLFGHPAHRRRLQARFK